ncbi:MAG: transposase [Burkholderiales bacterium]|nr:MAG: transposase [Burkholderiales bacterium]
MARLARLFAPGFPQHITQRGHNRQPVFLADGDRLQYLAWLFDAAAERDLPIHAYALMGNHVHLLVTAPAADTVGRVLQSVGRNYVRYFNRKYGRSGTLWEGRYRSTVVQSERYLMAVYRYIDLNPVRAGIVSDPELYRWSSFRHHAGLDYEPRVSDHTLYWQLGNTPFERHAAYKALCAEALGDAELDQIREATRRGWALADATFVRSRAFAPNRQALPRPRGRPRRRPARAPVDPNAG